MKNAFAYALVFVFAIGAAPSSKTPELPPETPDAVTHHSVAIDGRTLGYTARAGTITLRNESDQPTARMFYTAYTLEGTGAARPVTFIYNGGPGSSTMWLRMGSFGPVRVVTTDGTATGPPPYRLIPNEYSLLDKSDLVFIDMPDSGYGRIIGVGKPKDFFGVDPDVRAFGQFIERYITQFNRWNSPKFLFGESYGTPRSAALVDYLQKRGVAFNGVVLLSSILNFDLDYPNDPIGGGDWAYVLYLPTEAATAWYHDRIPNKPRDLQPFLRQVEHFAMTEYLDALAKGAQLSAAEKADVVRRLHQYLGVSSQYALNSNLRIPYWRYEKELLRTQDKVVGRLDSRFETYELDSAADSPNWDPTETAITSAFVATANQYYREDLKYETTLPYRANIYSIIAQNGDWDFKHNGNQPTNTAPDLAEAMTQNPHLHVFSANGYYDFATPYFTTVYTLNHLNLAPALQKNIAYGFYESGHMVYLNPTSLVAFKRDLAKWYDDVLAGR